MTRLTLLLVVAVAVGCELAPAAPVDPTALQGIPWEAVTVNGVEPVEGRSIAVAIAGGDIKGSTGCNSFAGKASIVGARLVVTNLAATAAACAEPEANEIERVFMAVLSSQPEVRLSGGRLVLRSAAGEIVFERSNVLSSEPGPS